MTLMPSRFNVSCGISSMRIIKSPGIPPLGAAFPFPLIDNCIPSLTPAGMLIAIVSSPLSNPSPRQVVHLDVISTPPPLQLGQVLVVCLCTSIVLVTRLTHPTPPQVAQVWQDDLSFAPVPPQVGHCTCLFTLTFFSPPLAISSK